MAGGKVNKHHERDGRLINKEAVNIIKMEITLHLAYQSLLIRINIGIKSQKAMFVIRGKMKAEAEGKCTCIFVI